MYRTIFTLFFICCFGFATVFAATEIPQHDPKPDIQNQSIQHLQTSQERSCTPRKTCTKITSCEAAYWYLKNCSWGQRLDRDKDGIPCESLCQ